MRNTQLQARTQEVDVRPIYAEHTQTYSVSIRDKMHKGKALDETQPAVAKLYIAQQASEQRQG